MFSLIHTYVYHTAVNTSKISVFHPVTSLSIRVNSLHWSNLNTFLHLCPLEWFLSALIMSSRHSFGPFSSQVCIQSKVALLRQWLAFSLSETFERALSNQTQYSINFDPLNIKHCQMYRKAKFSRKLFPPVKLPDIQLFINSNTKVWNGLHVDGFNPTCRINLHNRCCHGTTFTLH